MESLLKNKKEKMEEATNLKLLPTYSFWRMYTKLSDLSKHKDRESCEISVTIQIGSDGSNWPIYMNGKPITLEQLRKKAIKKNRAQLIELHELEYIVAQEKDMGKKYTYVYITCSKN